jgi:hypothetical protein
MKPLWSEMTSSLPLIFVAEASDSLDPQEASNRGVGGFCSTLFDCSNPCFHIYPDTADLKETTSSNPVASPTDCVHDY